MLKGDEDKASNYMKVAVNLDWANYKLLQKDPIFAPIRGEVPKPEKIKKQEIEEVKKETDKEMKQAVEEDNGKKKIASKEKKVFRHLFKTNLLMENLSNEDLMMIRNRREKQKMQEKQQKEQEQEQD